MSQREGDEVDEIKDHSTRQAQRGSLAHVRNPVLALPSAAMLSGLDGPSKRALCAVLLDLRRDAALRSDLAWKRHKAPMAAYWCAVSVYAGHIARAIKGPSNGGE